MHPSFFLLLLISFPLILSQSITTFEHEIDGILMDMQWCGTETEPEDSVINTFRKIEKNENNTNPIEKNGENLLLDQPVYYKKKVFVLTSKGSVYFSEEEGKNFKEMEGEFKKIGKKEGEANDNELFKISTILTSKSDPNLIFFKGFKDFSYISENCGRNLQLIRTEPKLADIKLSNNERKYMMGSVVKDCSEEKYGDYCGMLKDLYVSQDVGKSWKKVQENVVEYAWACQNKYFRSIVPSERIIITKIVLNKEGKPITNILISNDFFKSTTMISEGGYRFFMTDDYLYVLEAISLVEKRFALKISPNYYGEYHLKNVEIPIERIKDHSFTILDSSETSIFINVNHYGDDSKMGMVYISNYEGSKFVLSLLDNARDSKGFCDFEKIKSVEGVFIANHYEFTQAERYKSTFTSTSTDKTKSSSLDNFKKSVITHDKGSTWHLIPAPEFDINHKPLHCNGECSLHLRGFTDKFSNPIYSSDGSIGIIMGVGNTGLFLSQKVGDVGTYLSRDGGHNWIHIHEGSNIYEIGDHGGLIVLVSDTAATNVLQYSWDEGLTWNTYTFTSKPIDVTNIIIEPLNMSLKFLIYGTMTDEKQKGIIIYLDFASLKKRVCSGVWNPGAEESDYEIWVPGVRNNSKCLFGKRIKYVRRKRDRECFNGEDFEKKRIIDYCPCTDDDWECDYGFFRKNEQSECLPISKEFEIKWKNETKPESCKDFYEIVSGYRKIPGDYCMGGIEKGAKRVSCQNNTDESKHFNTFTNPYHYTIPPPNSLPPPPPSSSNSPSSFYYLILIFIIILLVLVFIWRNGLGDKLKNWRRGINKKREEKRGRPLKSFDPEEEEEF